MAKSVALRILELGSHGDVSPPLVGPGSSRAEEVSALPETDEVPF